MGNSNINSRKLTFKSFFTTIRNSPLKKTIFVIAVVFIITIVSIFLVLNQKQEIVLEVEALGGEIIYDLYEFHKPPAWVQVLESVFGDFPAYDVVVGITIISPEFTDENMKTLADIPHLGDVYIASENVTDKGLKYLSGLKEIEFLTIYSDQITDDGLAHLQGMKRLFHLKINSSGIKGPGLKYLKGADRLTGLTLHCSEMGDEGLHSLADLPELEHLLISGTQVSDLALDALLELKHLRSLCIEETNFSEKALQQFQAQRPYVEIDSCPLSRKPPSYLPAYIAWGDDEKKENPETTRSKTED